MFKIEPHVFSDAVRYFWHTRARQASKQQERGVSDQGTRSSVTGGKQMDGFVAKITELMMSVGVPQEEIFFKKCLELPGYYRPTKKWDIVVKNGNSLVAAMELKSQVGSFGNNVNNRAEEAIGNAVDLWTAFRENAFAPSTSPWPGYFFLLQDCYESRNKGGRLYEPHFKVLPEFQNSTYCKRYETLCRKLVLERQYNSASFIMADQANADEKENYTEPAPDLTASIFLDRLLRQVTR